MHPYLMNYKEIISFKSGINLKLLKKLLQYILNLVLKINVTFSLTTVIFYVTVVFVICNIF